MLQPVAHVPFTQDDLPVPASRAFAPVIGPSSHGLSVVSRARLLAGVCPHVVSESSFQQLQQDCMDQTSRLQILAAQDLVWAADELKFG